MNAVQRFPHGACLTAARLIAASPRQSEPGNVINVSSMDSTHRQLVVDQSQQPLNPFTSICLHVSALPTINEKRV